MFQNQKRTKLKINLENKKQPKKNPLKLHKIEERNKEKMDLIQEKINFIHEKLSLFKDSVSSKNKNTSLQKRKIEKNRTKKEIGNKSIKPKDLLSTINISPNFQYNKYKSKFSAYE